MTIRKEILDELIRDYKNPEDLLGENGLLKQLTKALLLERAMNAELTHELGFERGDKAAVKESGNRRNGTSSKTVRSRHGEIEFDIPRDRESNFEPVLIKKHQRRFDGFDDAILSLYSRGLSTRDIKAHLEEIYGVEVSPDLISSVTEAVIEEVGEWQTRPLEVGLSNRLLGCAAGQDSLRRAGPESVYLPGNRRQRRRQLPLATLGLVDG